MSQGQERQLAPALQMTNEKCEMIYGKLLFIARAED